MINRDFFHTPRMSPQASAWTIIKLLTWTASYFKGHGVDSPRLTAEILLAHVLGVGRIDLYLRHDQPLSSDELKQFKQVIKRRARREPLAYITGKKEFFGRDFMVSPHVLIPRPETEILVETAIGLIGKKTGSPMRVLDIGTGSGAIVTTLAIECPGHHYLASDVSMPAIELALTNARLQGVSEKILFFAGDFLEPVSSDLRASLIVSNPPYIPSEEIPMLAPEVRAFEPIAALDGSTDGLSAIRRIMARAPDCMAGNGHLLFEIGYGQKIAVEHLARETGRFTDIHFIRDLAGIDRVAVLRK